MRRLVDYPSQFCHSSKRVNNSEQLMAPSLFTTILCYSIYRSILHFISAISVQNADYPNRSLTILKSSKEQAASSLQSADYPNSTVSLLKQRQDSYHLLTECQQYCIPLKVQKRQLSLFRVLTMPTVLHVF